MEKQLQFRRAERQDVPLILRFIRELAAYEKMEDQVVADEATLAEWLFERRSAEVCFALYFHNFSTSLGRRGSIWRTCMCCPSTGDRASVRPFCSIWPVWQWTGAAAGWSGGAWTGTVPASPFTALWAPGLWTSGRCTAWRGIPSGAWRVLLVLGLLALGYYLLWLTGFLGLWPDAVSDCAPLQWWRLRSPSRAMT